MFRGSDKLIGLGHICETTGIGSHFGQYESRSVDVEIKTLQGVVLVTLKIEYQKFEIHIKASSFEDIMSDVSGDIRDAFPLFLSEWRFHRFSGKAFSGFLANRSLDGSRWRFPMNFNKRVLEPVVDDGDIKDATALSRFAAFVE